MNLNDPTVTLALLKLNAVLGLTGFFKPDGTLQSVGIQCALCHSTVDNAFAPGIGHRLDGWANRGLNVGAIIALSPNLQPVAEVLEVNVATVKAVLNSWGPGRFDAELFMDGKAFRPDGKTAAVLIPPAFGLAGLISTPIPDGVQCPTGTHLLQTLKCTAKELSLMHVWTTPQSFRSQPEIILDTCKMTQT